MAIRILILFIYLEAPLPYGGAAPPGSREGFLSMLLPRHFGVRIQRMGHLPIPGAHLPSHSP